MTRSPRKSHPPGGSLEKSSAELLRHGLLELALDVSEATRAALLRYLDLLLRWNKTYNLTAVRDPTEMVTKHLLDSLSVVVHVSPGRILDVGSGAGLPALPLALARPELRVTALDSNQKKARFINQVVLELHIQNLLVVHRRVEDYQPTDCYDTVISRAFSSIPDFISATDHLLAPRGVWLAMKGIRPDAELVTLPLGCRCQEVIPLRVPGLEAERHLVVLAPV
ncbi:Ribosomal RNA small subunit methyltransferase G [Gammaproteobacteria bacterium]